MRHLIAALAAAGLAFAAVPAGAAEFTMRISHPVPTAHHMHKALLLFAEDVKQRTKGAVEIQIYPAEQLAKTAENFPAVARGAFEAALVVNAQWGTTIPEMAAPTIPFFFTELERIKKFPASEARKFLDEQLAKRGVHSI